MIAKQMLALITLLSTALATPAVNPTAASLPNPESVRHVPELAWHAAPPTSCTVTCWDQHEAGVHVAQATPQGYNEAGAGPHDSPYAGLCATKHPGCEGGFGAARALERIQLAIQASDFEALRANLEIKGAVAYFAPERNAVQIVGCNGEVIAHLPVSEDMRAAIAN